MTHFTYVSADKITEWHDIFLCHQSTFSIYYKTKLFFHDH